MSAIRLVTFNLANGNPNDLVAVNPRHVKAITTNSDTTTKIWLSLDDFWIVCGKFEDVKHILIDPVGLHERYKAAQEWKLENAFRKGQP